MKIGISGASGQLGQAVVKELVARGGGHELVAISRTPRPATGIEGRPGDYDRPESLAAAYGGLDRLLLIPSSDLRSGVRGGQMAVAIKAAVTAGVGHIVLMSAAGTRAQAEPAIGASYWTAEQTLIMTAPVWTILRMNYYAEALAQEAQMSAASGMLTGLSENRVAFVSRDDIAAAAAGILTGDGHAGAIYNATGPAALAGAERAALIAEVGGFPLGFVTLPEAALADGMAQMGLPEHVINAVIGIQRDFSNGAFDIVTGDIAKLAGRPPRTLREVLTELLSAT
ncbi:NAD(P)H-binding protein [Fuscovulum ytuae]|uniref:NAD(P)H-binding protein n=1 Tax=Fuscovulum ytuae TaxID=3042299 RepID=A0ABY8Q430_9RHOB|nr:NAD(P)H-binding protein [Fuscovulum sp. YMD61]WGV15027.1 NAD(P)H-binding protein [Fuscovulum sp. YMD61]